MQAYSHHLYVLSIFSGKRAVHGRVHIVQPYRDQHKVDVLRRCDPLFLKYTFSCLRPIRVNGEGVHCGTCNKCAERQKGFAEAGLTDPTPYSTNFRARDACSL